MNEQAIRKIVDDEIKKKLFQLPKIPPHKHDGTDNIKINQVNINYNNKFAAFLYANGIGGGGTIILQGGNTTVQTIGNTTYYPLPVQNPTRVSFYGIAYDNRNSPPSYKQNITGVAELGNCYDFNGSYALSKVKNGVIQSNDGLYITPGAPYVVADQEHIATVQDLTNINGGNNIVELDVVSFTTNSITVTATIAFDYWILTGSLIIT
jgi:hypothetical protein